jgi:hypothetical protein
MMGDEQDVFISGWDGHLVIVMTHVASWLLRHCNNADDDWNPQRYVQSHGLLWPCKIHVANVLS